MAAFGLSWQEKGVGSDLLGLAPSGHPAASLFSPFHSLQPPHTPLSTTLLPSWGPEVSKPLDLLILLKTSCSKFKAKAEQQPHLFSGSLRLKQ